LDEGKAGRSREALVMVASLRAYHAVVGVFLLSVFDPERVAFVSPARSAGATEKPTTS
jgi:hypothetical protein